MIDQERPFREPLWIRTRRNQLINHGKYLAPAMFIAAAVLPVCATADPITGGVHFSGDVTISTNLNTGAGTLVFDNVASQPYTFTVNSASGDLAGLSGGGTDATFGTDTAPINTTVNIPDFLTFVN